MKIRKFGATFMLSLALAAGHLSSQVLNGGTMAGSAIGPAYPVLPFTQIGTDAVIKKGGTILGWNADAIAAPSACWDGSQWVVAVSLWSISQSKWSTAFGTTADLALSPTWVSLQTPQGTDYIFGNGGIACPTTGHYIYAYAHYPSGGTGVISTETGTDLITWTPGTSSLVPGSYVSDPRIVINPLQANRLELWYGNYNSSPTTVFMQYGTDGVNWTAGGLQYTVPAPNGQPGECRAAYSPNGGPNILTSDMDTVGSAARFIQLLTSGTAQPNTWALDGTALQASNVTIPGMTPAQVFDAVIVWGNATHTGPGNIPYMLTAVGDNTSGSDNTNSDIVLSQWK